MIVRCPKCRKRFDDAYRTTICPHETFAANDGFNNFAHYPDSHLDDEPDMTSSILGAIAMETIASDFPSAIPDTSSTPDTDISTPDTSTPDFGGGDSGGGGASGDF